MRRFLCLSVFSALVCLSSLHALAQSLPSWSYDAQTGPKHWAEIAPENLSCARGTQQSPIALNTKQAAHAQAKEFKFNYQTGRLPVSFFNTARTLQGNVLGGVYTVAFKERVYQLVQFHLHTPSEHTLNGKRYPMELHLVHKDVADHLTVAGVFIEQAQENKYLASIFTDSSSKKALDKPFATAQAKIDLAALLPTQRQALIYTGSLTTPPCSEQVNWIVLEQPIEMSAEQITTFRQAFSDNHRPLQRKNHRFIKEE